MSHSISLFHYRRPVDRLIAGLKFHERFDYGRCLARLLSQFIQQHYSDRELPQVLVPVPLHWRRARHRGFNQSAVLATTVARALGIPLLPELLWRRRRTAAQTSLYSAAARRRNVANAFACRSALVESGIDHVALYLGDGQAIHAPSTGRHVIVAPVGNRWWQQRYVEARRVLPIR